MATARLQTVTFRDSRGFTSTMKFRVTGATPAALASAAQTVITAIQGITTLALQSKNGPENADPTEVVYPTFAEFGSVEDIAVFTFQTAAGALHRFRIPGPAAAIFLADGKTVDKTNTAVVAYVSAVTSNCVDAAGNGIDFGATGIRKKGHTRRKLGVFTLAPDNTTPDL